MLRHFPSLMQACVDDNCDEPEKIAHDAQQIDGTVMLTGGRRTSSEPPWRPRGHGLMRVAIIGAGISGLACARRLRDAGLGATLFDKSRGLSGRLPPRRANPGTPAARRHAAGGDRECA